MLLAPVALPLALLFGAGVRIRNLLYGRGALSAHRAPLPVISVGNLTVGGTGKTPVSGWIVDRLQAKGTRPALITRGYGADEVELHRRWNPEAPVIVDSDRLAACRRAAEAGAGVCVLDDGFQHRRLARDVDIVLLSPADPLPARLLPRGPYREPLGALRRADLVLIPYRTEEERKRCRELTDRLGRHGGFPPVYPLSLEPGAWEDLAGRPASAPEGPVVVLCSVARPESVASVARTAGAAVEEVLVYPDHHEYDDEDVGEIRRSARGRTLVTTEKDAVKLTSHRGRLGDPRVVPLRPAPVGAVARALDRALDGALAGETGDGAPRS